MSRITKGFLLVLIAVMALMLLGSVVFSLVGDAKYHLEGYSREKAMWVRGNLKGWLEDNWVPYRLMMEIVASGYFEVTIQHDYEWFGSGGPDPGVNMCKSELGDPFYGSPLFWDEPTSDDFWIGDETGVLLPISVITTKISDLIESNTIVIQYTSTFTVPSEYVGKVIYLYWTAHLAIGSSGWSGSSLHAHTTATGRQDVPIAIPPHNEIYGHKFYDYNHNGIVPDDGDYGIEDWAIRLKGNYLGDTISWDTQTNDNGYYKFSGLPDGTWTITEELRTAKGWVQTTVSTYTVTLHGGQIKGPYDFGNFLLDLAIDVEKSGPTMAHENDTITYTITVTNEGRKLYDVSVIDTLLGNLTGYLPDNELAVGEVNTFTKTYTVPTPQGPDVENTVNASGEDVLGQGVSDTASWSVDILHPAIDVEKSGPEFAHEGDSITYTITVRNVGDCPLYNVTVIDTLLDDLTARLLDDTLDVGEVNTFDVSYKVPVPQVDDVDNTVTASGEDALHLSVFDTADWTVQILHPKIHVEKSGPATAHEGENITYEIVVSNTGDCDLFNVTLIDTLLGPIYSDSLLFGESKTFYENYTVPVCEGTPPQIKNTVTASGTDALGLTVNDVASWTVDVILPYPPVAMFTEDPVEPVVGQTVTFNASTSQPGFDGFDDCPITEYRWDFDGDGQVDLVSDKPVVTFIFDAEGEYNVTLTVYAPPGPRGLPCYDPYDTMWHIKKVVPPVGGYAVPIENVGVSSPGVYMVFAVSAVVLVAALVLTKHRRGSRRKASEFS